MTAGNRRAPGHRKPSRTRAARWVDRAKRDLAEIGDVVAVFEGHRLLPAHLVDDEPDEPGP